MVLGAQTFRERATKWLTEVRTRRFGAYRDTTVPTIQYALDKHVLPIIGDLPLSQVNNRTCRPLVAAMFDAGLSVCSVNNYMKLVLQVVRSLRDAESGLPIHNLKWNREYLDLPKIDRDEQNVPAFDAEQINKLIAESDGEEQMLYILLATTGLRIGECLALETRHVLNGGRTLHIEQAVNRFGKIVGLVKTRASRRHVDVTSEVAAHINEYIKGKDGLLFSTSNGSPYLVGNLRTRWLQERFPDYGFHSFRRYRVTHLEAVRAHGHLTKVWTGHALSGVTEQYGESLKRNTTLRLAESEKCGTGLALPAPTCSKFPLVRQWQSRRKFCSMLVIHSRGRLAQLVRAPVLQAGGRRFEPCTAHHSSLEFPFGDLSNSA